MTAQNPTHVDGRTRDHSLPRRLSVIGLWLLMINGMIGAGIFGAPAELARLTGALSPLVFLLGALLMAPVMLCFAQLGGSVSGSGGPARYVGIAFGPAAGFQAGWALYVARLTAFAANLNLLANSLLYFWPDADTTLVKPLLMTALIVLMAVANIVSVRGAMGSLGALTVLKLLPLLILLMMGLGHLDLSFAPTFELPLSVEGLGAALLLVIYAYVGFESGLIPAGEARDPQRDMPRALLLSLGICAVLYAMLQWVSISVLPQLGQSTRPLVDVGAALLGTTGAVLLVAAVLASIGGNLIGSMFSSPRITHALALEQQLPAQFGRVHPRFETPVISILVYAVAAALLALSGGFVWLAVLSVLSRLLLFLACIASMPRVREQAEGAAGAMRVGGAIRIAAVVVCLGLLTQVTLGSWLAIAVLLAAGSVLYFMARRTSRLA